MFGRWLRGSNRGRSADAREELAAVVRVQLPEADEETVFVVAAIAGLLAAVAYADRNYGPAEEERVQQELGRVHGMSPAGVEAICGVLRARVLEMSTLQIPGHCRTLMELADQELRTDVLQTLVALAAADGTIETAEVNALRLLTGALGLSQDDYNRAQEKYRDRLSVLG